MSITFDLPADIEQSLRKNLGDLDNAAKEAALVELYRQEKISLTDFCRALGITRLQSDAILKKHNVLEDLPNDDEINQALRHLGAS